MRNRTAWEPTGAPRTLALVVLAATLLAACGLRDDDGESADGQPIRDLRQTSTTEALGDPVPGGDLTVALESENAGWLPGKVEITSSFRNVAFAVYDPLVVAGDDGESHPYLAQSVTSDAEFDEWTVTLRPGIRFHDGTALDASVMKEIFDDFLMAPGSTALGVLDEVKELRVDDELTFTYVLTRPNGAFPFYLTGPIGWPFSPTAARAAGDAAGAQPVGTGPFRFQSWDPDDRLVVTRNEDYWRPGLPHLDRITFRPVPDEQLRLDLLLTGAVDAIQSMRGHTIRGVLAAEDEGFTAHTFAGDDASVALMNTANPPFDDVRIRRAVARMYDPTDMAEVLGDDGLVERSTQFFGADSPWYSERVAAARPAVDPGTARELVHNYATDPARSDGLPVGTPPKLTFTCLSDPTLIEISQLVMEAAQAVGFDASVEHVDTATLITSLRGQPDGDPPFRGDYLVGCFRSQTTGDPATTFGAAFGAPSEEAANFTNFTSAELVTLIDELRRTKEFNQRYAIVEQIGIIINEATPLTFVSGTPATIGVRNEVKNVAGWTTPGGEPGEGIPYGVTRWGEVWIDR
jgi:peptide/nickel transport system substrate-binding protein